MRIAVLTDGIYPFVIGGMQRHSYFLAKYLAQKKIYVRVYHCVQTNQYSNYSDTLKKIFSEEELNYLEFIQIPFDFRSRFPGYYLLESYLYSKRIYEDLIKDIHQFDFIYSKGFTAWYLLQHKKNNFPKIGVKLHGYEMYQYSVDFKTKLQHYLLRIPSSIVSQKADIVFSYGGKISDILIHRLKIPQQKIIEIPTGIEKSLIVDKVTEEHSEINFVFIGRYEKRKGIENINEAIKQLIRQNKVFKFHFIGAIPEFIKIKDDRVIYHGVISDYTKIKELLRQMDVLVCPSYSEGMPNVIVEAMANGLTVIATDVGAVKLLVDDKTGYLLNNNHPKTLEMILIDLIGSNKKVLQTKKNTALQHIQNFTWEKIIDQIINEIKRFVPLR
ncbi:MAG: hypothetical protein KatS3mg027_0567 [Bacteroidia bacterium]|nr:MAG: hypothetical protein KatS3mg027_0567 [Bacteroidia bacterium]